MNQEGKIIEILAAMQRIFGGSRSYTMNDGCLCVFHAEEPPQARGDLFDELYAIGEAGFCVQNIIQERERTMIKIAEDF